MNSASFRSFSTSQDAVFDTLHYLAVISEIGLAEIPTGEGPFSQPKQPRSVYFRQTHFDAVTTLAMVKLFPSTTSLPSWIIFPGSIRWVLANSRWLRLLYLLSILFGLAISASEGISHDT